MALLSWKINKQQLARRSTITTTNNNQQNYSTTDIALAAYLHSEGCELMDVDDSKFPSIFYFSDNSAELHKLVQLFECAKAQGNIYQFYRSYKMIIGKIKEGSKSGGRKAG